MKYVKQLSIEVAMVALITALFLGLAVTIGGPIERPGKALIVGAVIGACIHLGFELLGGNTYYCRSGAACLR
jgi:hypothetical protein